MTAGEAKTMDVLLRRLAELLAEIEEAWSPTPPPKLTTVAGQGRGSKKPKAKLKSA